MENTSKKYCQSCGTALDAGTKFCPVCGETRDFLSVPPNRIKRPVGVLILGILQILGSLGAIFVGITLGGAAFLFFPSGFGVIIAAISAIPLIFAILFIAGFNVARLLMIIGAILDIITLVGIIWGIILLWYLTRPRVRAYFKQPRNLEFVNIQASKRTGSSLDVLGLSLDRTQAEKRIGAVTKNLLTAGN